MTLDTCLLVGIALMMALNYASRMRGNELLEVLITEIVAWKHHRRECSCYNDNDDNDGEDWKRGKHLHD